MNLSFQIIHQLYHQASGLQNWFSFDGHKLQIIFFAFCFKMNFAILCNLNYILHFFPFLIFIRNLIRRFLEETKDIYK